jgi:RNA polymerase sigma-70 factor (ECF subfamily)
LDELTRSRWIAAHVLPHEREVRGWLRRNASSLSLADIDDLIQEGYSRIWRADFSAIANGRGYFYKVVRNALLEQVRRARIVPMERIGEIDVLRIPSNEPEPERRTNARQELEQLWRIVERLPRQPRRAFELQKVKGLSQREIAQEMGISEKTVEKYLGIALARIMEAMAAGAGRSSRTAPDSGAGEHDARKLED